ncbi:MAG: flagellar basal body P-ring formation chaperone FlgA [Pseudomonadota bacterium]
MRRLVVAIPFFFLVLVGAAGGADLTLEPGQPLVAQGLERLLAEPLADAVGAEAVEVRTTAPALPLSNPYRQTAKLTLANLRLEPGDRFSAVISIDVGDAASLDLAVAGEHRRLVAVLVPARAIAKGETLAADALERKLMRPQHVRADWVLETKELVGMETRRRLVEGRPIRDGSIGRPLTIRRGDRVTLLYENGALRLELPGEARADGRLGDRIAVRNRAGTLVEGAVVAPGRIEVEPIR